MAVQDLTPEEKERERQARAQATMGEMDQMDQIFDGVPTEQEEVPVEEMAEATPEVVEPEVVPEPEVEVVEAEAEAEDEYGIGDLINQMAREAMAKQAPVVEQPVIQTPVQPVVQEQPVAQPIPMSVQQIVSVEEMKEAFDSPEKFVELLNRVYASGIQASTEQALLRLPQVARQVSMQVATQADLARKFYEDNAELANYKDFVAYCAQQVEGKHADWTYQQILEETAKVAKSRLPALRRAKREAQGRPALPGSGKGVGRSRAPAQGVSALEQEINEMPNRF